MLQSKKRSNQSAKVKSGFQVLDLSQCGAIMGGNGGDTVIDPPNEQDQDKK